MPMPDNPQTPAPEPDLFEEIARLRAAGEPAALATVIGTKGSTPGKETMRVLVQAAGRVLGTVGGGCMEADVIDAAHDVIRDGAPKRLTFRLTENATGESGLMCGGEVEVFIEPLTVPQLMLFGAGHVSKDISAIATKAGFRVTVTDDRAAFASAERFPEAATVIAGDTFEDCFRRLAVTPGSYLIVVTRGHNMDRQCLDFALHTKAGYIGLIGSKVKIRNLLTRLGTDGRLEGVDLDRLHAPIGLDLGGGTHGEIAVAVVAELIAHRRGHLDRHAPKRLAGEEMRTLAARAATRNAQADRSGA